MSGLRERLVQVADNQISYLAQRSRDLDQETRITVYAFNNTVRCVVYDKDVLRLPSIRSHYAPIGMTALIDATLKSQDDLAHTAQIYGNHAFLTYVLTDGQENASRAHPTTLSNRLAALPANWTVAVFVPDQTGKFEAKKFGFPADNIAVWDVSAKGLAEAGETIRRTTDAYMQNRSTGVHGSRSLFSMGVDSLNKQTIKAAKLNQLPIHKYRLLDVNIDGPVREYVESSGYTYNVGNAFYQLTKTESIQASKHIAVVERATGEVHTGVNARTLIGLPPADVRVKPDFNPLFDVFIQSTSVNRKLLRGTKLLLLV